jgi:hypothetical protein
MILKVLLEKNLTELKDLIKSHKESRDPNPKIESVVKTALLGQIQTADGKTQGY